MSGKLLFGAFRCAAPRAGLLTALFVTLSGTLTGCPSFEHEITSAKTYTPPAEYAVPGLAIVEADFEATWRRLEQGVETAPFRLTVSQKSNRFAVVELDAEASGHALSELADCGRLERRIVRDGEPTIFAYALVEAARDRVVIPDEDHFEIQDIERRPNLTIRTTVFLRPETPERTRVTLNSRYMLGIDSSGESLELPRRRSTEAPPPEAFGPERLEIRFTSFEEGAAQGAENVRCRATGVIEEWLLSIVSGDNPTRL